MQLEDSQLSHWKKSRDDRPLCNRDWWKVQKAGMETRGCMS